MQKVETNTLLCHFISQNICPPFFTNAFWEEQRPPPPQKQSPQRL